MAELTVPQIDFSMLGNLGNVYKQAQSDQMRQQTLASLGQGGQADATALLKSGDLSLAQLGINLRNRQEDQARQAQQDARLASNDTFSHNIESQRLDIARRAAARQDEGPVEQSAQRRQALIAQGGNPNSPEGRAYIIGGQYSDPEATKPLPVETLGGTKFMVRQPNGGFTLVDPSNMVQRPAGPVQSSPGVVGDAEGVARGLYDAPAAQGQRPPVQTSDGQPASFAARFPGQGGPDAQSVPGQPAPAADPQAVDPKTGRREGFLQTLDPQVQGYIKKIADYEIDPRTTSVKGGMREKLMSAVAQYDPTYNQNEFGTRAKAMKDFGTGSQGNSVRSFDVAIDHLDLLKHYTKALDSGDVRIINSIRNKWLEETGSPLPTNLQAVAPIVGAEVSKAVIGSNNALADREELRKPLLSANSVPQINGAIEAYQGLMAGQLKGLKKQYEDTTGKKNFDSRVRESTRSILLKGQSSATKNEPIMIDGYTITEH